MNFEPQKIFIGLVDFFSILMPGAMLVYLGKGWPVLKNFGVPAVFELSGPEAGIVFLFASYLVGHFAFLFGSVFDHWVYDRLRRLTRWGQMSERLAKGHKPSARWLRRLVSGLFFGDGADNALMQVLRIKARALKGLAADDAVNAFQWSKARLTRELPEGLLAVQRFEADSKFFRSFVVVLGVLAASYVFQHEWPLVVVCFLGMLPALWRYIDQRFKAIQQAYWLVVTLESMKVGPIVAVMRDDELTHAGGIVYRRTLNSKVELLLVEAQKVRDQRVLPKGHIEPGEEPRATAVREIIEETGYWARVEKWLGDSRLDDDANSPFVRWFLLELCEEPRTWPPECRQRVWLSLPQAQEAATFQQTKKLLEQVGQLSLFEPSQAISQTNSSRTAAHAR